MSAGGTRRRPRAVSEGTATLPAALCCLRPLGRNQSGNAYGGRELAVTAPSPPRRSGRDFNAAGAMALAPPFPKRGPRQGQQLRGPPASLWHLGTWRRVPGCPIAATSGVRAWGQTPWRSATLDKLLDHCRVPQRPRLWSGGGESQGHRGSARSAPGAGPERSARCRLGPGGRHAPCVRSARAGRVPSEPGPD